MSLPAPNNRKTLLSQGLDLVGFLAHCRRGLGVTEIAEEMKLPKSSAFRLLGLLMDLGFVQKNARSQRYTISPEVFKFVYQLAHDFGPNERLTELMTERAEKLKCAVYLSMLSGRHTYVIFAAGHLGNTLALGSTGPTYASSAGKVIVSHLPQEEWDFHAPTEQDKPLTDHTNLAPARFLQELQVAKQSGVAWNLRETSNIAASVASLVKEVLHPPRLAVALLVNYKDLPVYDRVWLEEQTRALAAELAAKLASDPS